MLLFLARLPYRPIQVCHKLGSDRAVLSCRNRYCMHIGRVRHGIAIALRLASKIHHLIPDTSIVLFPRQLALPMNIVDPLYHSLRMPRGQSQS
jgi:hypothetical protein